MSVCTEDNIKVFSFKTLNCTTGDVECMDVSINEELRASYSSYSWPSAPVLAWYLWEHHEELQGKNVLELGAGTALPSIVAAKCGAYVTISENASLLKSIQNIHTNCKLNSLQPSQFQVVGITWGLFLHSLFKLHNLDLIIASDCFYEPTVFEDLIVTVSFLLDRNPRAKFLTVYQERSADWSIEHLLKKWNLRCKSILLDNSDITAGFSVPELIQNHTLYLLEISKLTK